MAGSVYCFGFNVFSTFFKEIENNSTLFLFKIMKKWCNLLGIGLFKQIDIELMVYLGVRGQYVGGIAKPTSLPEPNRA